MEKEEIKTFEDACKILGIEPTLPEVSNLFTKHRKAVIAFYKLSVIINALNDGWEPDWGDCSQRKWFNWFYHAGSNAGFVYSYSYYSPSTAYSAIGSRLCFETYEHARYAAENFRELYEDYLLMN